MPAETPTEPSAASGATVQLALGETVRVEGVAVRFAEVVDDSRCPERSQCVWEGIAHVRLVVGAVPVVLAVLNGPERPDEATSATASAVGPVNVSAPSSSRVWAAGTVFTGASFTAFTARFGDFKPPEHNLLGVAIAETVFEPRVGGHIYDRGIDGSECRWARVLAY